eukprot:2651289-Prymnesium_polylepis.1
MWTSVLACAHRTPHTALLPLSPGTCAHESRTKVASPAECCETSYDERKFQGNVPGNTVGRTGTAGRSSRLPPSV